MQAPDVRVRVVNVVDLLALQQSQQHPQLIKVKPGEKAARG
ncbi:MULTISPECIES: hypothetical protein [Pseudomonas]|nr:hypothetical protein F7661_17960 [Pseudomonas sp. CFA]